MSLLISLKNRQDFVRLNQEGVKWITPSLVLQGGKNSIHKARVGITATRKLGKAVLRNRAKRRLREVLKHCQPTLELCAADYVLIARSAALTKDFSELVEDLKWALKHVQRLLKEAS